MEPALFAIGQISITLVGFAALLKAFERKNATDAHTDPRIQSIVEQGLVLVILSFLPSLLISYDISSEAAARISSFLAATWLLRWLYIMFVIRQEELKSSITAMFRFAVVLHYAAFFSFALASANVFEKTEPLYFTGIVLTFACVGWAFLAQFRIERSE